MEQNSPPLRYSSYTYAHPSALVRYPHIRRLIYLARYIGHARPKRWLDYGAGDAEVYRFYAQEKAVTATLYEPAAHMLAAAVEKLGGIRGQGFEIVSHLDQIEGRFDLITVFEVLEHLPLPERITFYRMAAQHLAPGGRILIEVPIEYGPILLLKEFGRRVLKGRKSDYGFGELLASAFLGRVRDIHHRYDRKDARTVISPHHGFDIRRFEREAARIGTITRLLNSPFPWLPGWMNQCRIYEFRLECHDPEAKI